jgi:hypothetical protein
MFPRSQFNTQTPIILSTSSTSSSNYRSNSTLPTSVNPSKTNAPINQPFQDDDRDSSGSPTAMSDSYPIYDLYGSSIVSVTPASSVSPPLRPVYPSTKHSSSSPPFDPASLGLPLPPPKDSNRNVAGLYSSSGFDLIRVLARVAMRPKPQIAIGPIDMSCSFTVVDARKYDMPIVYASESFSKLTGYVIYTYFLTLDGIRKKSRTDKHN